MKSAQERACEVAAAELGLEFGAFVERGDDPECGRYELWTAFFRKKAGAWRPTECEAYGCDRDWAVKEALKRISAQTGVPAEKWMLAAEVAG